MKSNRISRNIPLMYAITFFQGMVLYASIASLFRQARGLTLAEYAVTDGFCYLFQLLFEIPFGLLADRIGYKKTLVVSNGFYLLSKVIFWRAFSFGSFLLERLFFSIALAGLSGVDSSILYLSRGTQDSQKLFSWQSAFGTAGMLTGCLIFTLFLSHHYDAAALATVITYGIAFVLSFFIEDVHSEEPAEEKPSLRRLADIFAITKKDRKFLWFILGETLVSYGSRAVITLLSQNKYLALGMTEQHIGFMDIALSILALNTVFSAVLTKKLGFKGFMVLGMGVIAVSTITIGYTENVMLFLICITLVDLSQNMLSPLISDLYSKRVTVSDRATQLSVYAMISELLSFGISFLMSAVSARTYSGSFLLCAGMAVTGIVLFAYCYRSEKNFA